MESLAGALGIAYLAPTAEAGRFQRRPGDGLRGYGLVTGGERRLTLSLWMENGRHLNDRTGQDGFYYEAWLDEISLGPFNAESGGHGAMVATLDLTGERKAWPTGAPPAVATLAEAFGDGLPKGLEVRVTAEPFGGTPAGGIPVLTGQLVWLGKVGVAGANVDEALSLSGAPELGAESAVDTAEQERGEAEPTDSPAQAAQQGWQAPIVIPEVEVAEADPVIETPDEPSVAAAEELLIERPGPTAQAEPPIRWELGNDIFNLEELPDPLLEELPDPLLEELPDPLLEELPDPLLEAFPDPLPEEQPSPPPEPETEVVPRQSSRREEHLTDYLDQSLVIHRRTLIKPSGEPHRLASVLQLKGAHPLVPRVYATGSLDGERGGLTLAVRNLPTPAALGKSEATGRPWSAYRAWLTHARTGATMAIGLLSRVWGDQWRLEVPEGLALTRFDTVLVCLGDRTDSQPKPEPIVLMGSLLE